MAVIFIISWFVLLFYAVRLIAKGWTAASELGGKQFINEKKRYVTRTVHPEMRDLKEENYVCWLCFVLRHAQFYLMQLLCFFNVASVILKKCVLLHQRQWRKINHGILHSSYQISKKS